MTRLSSKSGNAENFRLVKYKYTQVQEKESGEEEQCFPIWKGGVLGFKMTYCLNYRVEIRKRFNCNSTYLIKKTLSGKKYRR